MSDVVSQPLATSPPLLPFFSCNNVFVFFFFFVVAMTTTWVNDDQGEGKTEFHALNSSGS